MVTYDGADPRSRTGHLSLTGRVLYQMSYAGMAGRQGIEPCWPVLETSLIPDHAPSRTSDTPPPLATCALLCAGQDTRSALAD